MTVVGSVVEDVGCRYSLACSKLRSLLQPLVMSPSATNSLSQDSQINLGTTTDPELENRIRVAYQVCTF